jgi:hypothetical protein
MNAYLQNTIEWLLTSGLHIILIRVRKKIGFAAEAVKGDR